MFGFFRGKGDYHRLGHGTDDHVRRPRRVSALQGKKIVDVACGSLHCVACTDAGKTDKQIKWVFHEPRCEKTGLGGFRPGLTQTRLYNHRI